MPQIIVASGIAVAIALQVRFVARDEIIVRRRNRR
jgi:hypothetical protein